MYIGFRDEITMFNLFVHVLLFFVIRTATVLQEGCKFSWFGFVVWHINLSRLFNAKAILLEEQ